MENCDSAELARLNIVYGKFLGNQVAYFINKNNLKPHFVSSHGHTIFHQPQNSFTFQAGAGAAIAAECKLPVVCDFRTLDVALGGQGAPLVPIGDKLLFNEYEYCLNLGGFANVSFEYYNQRLAFDICPVNIVLNHYTQKLGIEYDKNGDIASKGTLNKNLLDKLNSLEFYSLPANTPKSLGKEWVQKYIIPLIDSFNESNENILATYIEHIVMQLFKSITKKNAKVLISGGGVYNTFLINRLKVISGLNIIIPDKNTIEFKEALIFAFLGVLRVKNEINTLKSVTGAIADSSGGSVYAV